MRKSYTSHHYPHTLKRDHPCKWGDQLIFERKFNYMNTLVRGLTLDTVMDWLNISRGYVYRLIREDELQLVSQSPLLISIDSVISKIGSTFPNVVSVSGAALDYQLKQDSLQAVQQEVSQ